MLVRFKVQKNKYQLGEVWGVKIAINVVRWDDEIKAAWPYNLYSSDNDEKLTIIILMVVIKLKNKVCAMF